MLRGEDSKGKEKFIPIKEALQMVMVKIRFRTEEEDTRGFYLLMRRGQVVCLPDGIYEIQENLLEVLEEAGIPYEVIEREGIDGAYKTLRDLVAAPV